MGRIDSENFPGSWFFNSCRRFIALSVLSWGQSVSGLDVIEGCQTSPESSGKGGVCGGLSKEAALLVKSRANLPVPLECLLGTSWVVHALCLPVLSGCPGERE